MSIKTNVFLGNLNFNMKQSSNSLFNPRRGWLMSIKTNVFLGNLNFNMKQSSNSVSQKAIQSKAWLARTGK